MKTLTRTFRRWWRWLRGRKRHYHPQLQDHSSNVQLRTVLGEDFYCLLHVPIWKGCPRPQIRRFPIYNLATHFN